MWRRRALYLLSHHNFFSSQPNTPPSLHSFLHPSLFSLPLSLSSPPSQTHLPTLAPDLKTSLLTSLQTSLSSHHTDSAWKAFKTLSNFSCLPNRSLVNSLVTHLADAGDTLNLKRGFAVAAFLLEKDAKRLDLGTVGTLLGGLRDANAAAAAFALVRLMFENRFFAPFGVWGGILVEISRKNGSFGAFLRVFKESCRVVVDEKLDCMRPDLDACNAALEGCCRELESISEAEGVIDTMAILGVRPDESSFGLLAYLYALKGVKEKIIELEGLMGKFGFVDRSAFLCNLISGYVKSGDLESVSGIILRDLGENADSCFSEETFCEIVRGFIQNGTIKDLANLINEAQKLETKSLVVEKSIGYGIVNACVNLGFLDKAHNVLDEMNTEGCSIGLGVYIPILKAYCKEQRTAEATQLVMEISNSGLELDVYTYESLIEAAMSSQDFQSAFSLFRDMREARVADLKGSYLTIMTGLTENHRPELMAAFLDEIVEDPRVEIGTHDWNSILHAFCKGGRLEDARRTFRRMLFLQFEPNEQTYLSLINGYANAEKYFSVLMLWNEVKKRISIDGEKRFKLDNNLVDAFLFALVKGGYFDAVMQVVEKSQEMKIFVDKWRYKQAFMEKHKKLRVPKLRKRNFKKMEALVAFKNWAGLST